MIWSMASDDDYRCYFYFVVSDTMWSMHKFTYEFIATLMTYGPEHFWGYLSKVSEEMTNYVSS